MVVWIGVKMWLSVFFLDLVSWNGWLRMMLVIFSDFGLIFNLLVGIMWVLVVGLG